LLAAFDVRANLTWFLRGSCRAAAVDLRGDSEMIGLNV
jgi:hypothetical protein